MSQEGSHPSKLKAALPARNGPILAGLVPSAVVCLMMLLGFLENASSGRFWNEDIEGLLVGTSPFVANLLLGVIVGRTVSRRRFVYGMGVAVAGWAASFFVVGIIWFMTGHQADPSNAGLGLLLLVGMLASPIAGIASAVSFRS